MEKVNFSAYTIDGLLALLAGARVVMQQHFWGYAMEPSSRTYKLFSIQRDFVEEIKSELADRGAREFIKISHICFN